MVFFEIKENILFFRNDGELFSVSAWGKNNLLIQSSLMDLIPDGDIALLTPAKTSPVIEIIDERHASFTNGNIRAELFVHEWGNALQTTLNLTQELMFR